MIGIAAAKEYLIKINDAIDTPHLLIGGLAVEQYYKGRDSQDIDLICDHETAKKLLKLFPTSEWQITDRNNDDFRPSFYIQNNISHDLVVIFGPKISERETYDYIDLEQLREDAQAFQVKGRSLTNILIPSVEALAYTKLISAASRWKTSPEKARQDFEDFINLANHRAFRVNSFVALLRKANLAYDYVRDIAGLVSRFANEWSISNLKYITDILVFGNSGDVAVRDRLIEISRNGESFVINGAFPVRAMFEKTSEASQQHLISSLESAKSHFTGFGLTRNFYVDKIANLIAERSKSIDIKIFLMDPTCASRRDRYRIEPIEASFEDPSRFQRMIVDKYRRILSKIPKKKPREKGSLEVYFYDFPCSFAIENIDNVIRVMLYGHGVRGSEGPLFVFSDGNPFFSYFKNQLDWLVEMGSRGVYDEAKGHDLKVRKLSSGSAK